MLTSRIHRRQERKHPDEITGIWLDECAEWEARVWRNGWRWGFGAGFGCALLIFIAYVWWKFL